MWSRPKALPPYFGGKRRLLGRIFKHMPKPDEAPVFVDAFLGGGSVCLFAKVRGYRIVCNDIALRSYIAGKALIESNRLGLAREDMTRLFVYPGAESYFIEENFARSVVTTRHARFLDGAFPVACEEKEPKRWLLLLLLIKYMLRMRPMGTLKLHTSGCFPSLWTSSWSANQSLLELLSQWSLNGSHFWTESDCGQDCE